jgi:hypothetical protein
MGMEQVVTFAGGSVPPWSAVQQLLASHTYPVQLRMIDGELAFPDEQPTEPWREVRVGLPGGMVTLRREPDRVVCVTWGNAQGELLQAWNALTWALAEAGGGRIESPSGPLSAADYRQTADLPPALRRK